jgi:hypothetical protein
VEAGADLCGQRLRRSLQGLGDDLRFQKKTLDGSAASSESASTVGIAWIVSIPRLSQMFCRLAGNGASVTKVLIWPI